VLAMTSHNDEDAASSSSVSVDLRGMDLAYHGRTGLGGRAWWHAIRYLGRVLVALVRRFRLRRQLRRARGEFQQSMDEQLARLGKTALYMDSLDAPMLDEFRLRLDALTNSKAHIEETLTEAQEQWRRDKEALDERLVTMQERLADAQKEAAKARRSLDGLVEEHEALEQKVRKLSLEHDFIRERQAGGEDRTSALHTHPEGRSDVRSGRQDRIAHERDELKHRMELLNPKLREVEKVYREQAAHVSALKEEVRAFSADRDRRIFESALAEEGRYSELEGAASGLKELYLEAGRSTYQNRLSHPGLEDTMDRLDDVEGHREAVEADLNLLDDPDTGVAVAPLFKSIMLVGAVVASGVALWVLLS